MPPRAPLGEACTEPARHSRHGGADNPSLRSASPTRFVDRTPRRARKAPALGGVILRLLTISLFPERLDRVLVVIARTTPSPSLPLYDRRSLRDRGPPLHVREPSLSPRVTTGSPRSPHHASPPSVPLRGAGPQVCLGSPFSFGPREVKRSARLKSTSLDARESRKTAARGDLMRYTRGSTSAPPAKSACGSATGMELALLTEVVGTRHSTR